MIRERKRGRWDDRADRWISRLLDPRSGSMRSALRGGRRRGKPAVCQRWRGDITIIPLGCRRARPVISEETIDGKRVQSLPLLSTFDGKVDATALDVVLVGGAVAGSLSDGRLA